MKYTEEQKRILKESKADRFLIGSDKKTKFYIVESKINKLCA